MDVTKSDSANRELEIARRLLKDREESHSREIENMRTAQHDQVEGLSATQTDNIKRIRANAENELKDARDRFDEKISTQSDVFKKTLNDERADNYDRYGRLATESSRDRAKGAETKTRQLSDIIEGHDQAKLAQETTQKNELARIHQQNEEKRDDQAKQFSTKLVEKDKSTKKALDQQLESFNNAHDDRARKNAEDYNKQRTLSASHYRKILDDAQSEIDRTSNTFKERERQLVENRALDRKTLTGETQKSFNEFRTRSNEAINSTIDQSNQRETQSHRATEARIAKVNQDAASKEQSLRNEFRNLEADLNSQVQNDRSMSELKGELNEKRHRQEVHLASSAMAESGNLNAEILKDRNIDNLRNVEAKNRQNFEKHQTDMQRKMYARDVGEAINRSDTELQKNSALNKVAAERMRERNSLIRQYESRQNSLDELHERQSADQQLQTTETMKTVRDDAAKTIRDANRENTGRLYLAQRALRDRTAEAEFQRSFELDTADSKYRERTKRLSDNYNRAIMSNKDAFDDASAEYRHESMMHLAKNRGDAEHERRMAITDLVTKNRAMMQGYESKMSNMKDDFDGELAKTKAENDKAMKEMMRRTRETLDIERSQHGRELQAKDLQTKEKLRLQEEAFKDHVEKLKRNNELSLKKS